MALVARCHVWELWRYKGPDAMCGCWDSFYFVRRLRGALAICTTTLLHRGAPVEDVDEHCM